MKTLYIRIDGVEAGPFSKKQVEELLRTKLTSNDEIRDEGEDWGKISQYHNLMDIIKQSDPETDPWSRIGSDKKTSQNFLILTDQLGNPRMVNMATVTNTEICHLCEKCQLTSVNNIKDLGEGLAVRLWFTSGQDLIVRESMGDIRRLMGESS